MTHRSNILHSYFGLLCLCLGLIPNLSLGKTRDKNHTGSPSHNHTKPALPYDQTDHPGGVSIVDLSQEPDFDGIKVKKYAKFWEKWNLVTVRYRKDNGEQRFIYANNTAYRAMKEAVPIFPDGSMFGKVAYIVGDDPVFPNSMEPRQFTRIQLMQKNMKTYPNSDGWGYAIFVRGSGLPKNPKTTVVACHACHKLASERDFVFSKATFLGDSIMGRVSPTFSPSKMKTPPIVPPGTQILTHRTLSSLDQPGPESKKFKLLFVKEAFKDVSKKAQAAIAMNAGSDPLPDFIRIRSMPLFVGSLEESIGGLSQYSTDEKIPYLLIDENTGSFLAARAVPPPPECKTSSRLTMADLVHLRSQTHKPGQKPSTQNSASNTELRLMYRSSTTCNGITRWDQMQPWKPVL